MDNKDVLRRLKIIDGHFKKVIKMVKDDEYCIDILQQTTAVKNAIKKAEDILLKKHLHHCLVKAIKENNDEKVLDEILQVFKKANK